MTRPRTFRLAMIFSGLLIGCFTLKWFKPTPPDAVRRESETETKRVAREQTRSCDRLAPVAEAELRSNERPSPAPVNPWREELNALIGGREELFGPSGEERLKDLQDFVENVATADLPIVVAELEKIQMQKPTVFGRELQLHLLRQWAEKDVRSATDWITRMPIGSDRQEALAAAASAWAAQDLAEASTWAKKLADSTEQQKTWEVIAEEAAYDHPMEALNLANTLAPRTTLAETTARAITAWTRIAPEDATSWAKQIPDQESRDQAFMSIAAAQGESNPVAAVSLVATFIRPGPSQDETVIAIVQRWAQTDAPAAKNWIEQFPDGALRQIALAEIDEFAKSSQFHPPPQ